jgi:UDP-glucose 4-epimerase
MPEVLGEMLKGVRNSGRFVPDQGGDHRFNFIYANDVATATLATLAAPGPFGLPAYNVSSAEYWRPTDAADVARGLLPEAEIVRGRPRPRARFARPLRDRRGATCARL